VTKALVPADKTVPHGIKVLALATIMATQAHAADLEVNVGGVRNDHGHVLAQVCPKAQFLSPRCPWRAGVPAKPGQVTVRIPNVPPGTYAVQAYHDENDNKHIDRNWLGIPKEGLGFSRDAPFRFGPPRFDDAAFQLRPEGGRITLTLRYFD